MNYKKLNAKRNKLRNYVKSNIGEEYFEHICEVIYAFHSNPYDSEQFDGRIKSHGDWFVMNCNVLSLMRGLESVNGEFNSVHEILQEIEYHTFILCMLKNRDFSEYVSSLYYGEFEHIEDIFGRAEASYREKVKEYKRKKIRR